jgi:hypothetical protein
MHDLKLTIVIVAWVMGVVWVCEAIIKPAHGEDKLLCHLEPLTPDWHYRTRIDPRPDIKCWYDGPRMLARDRLYWAQAPVVTTIPHLLWQQEYRWTDPSGWSHQE